MKFSYRLAALLACALNAAAQAPAADAPAPEAPQPSALDAQLFYQLLLGELQVGGGEPGAGYSLILDAARRSKDPALYQRAVEIALQSRSGDAALQAARAWRQALPASRDASRYELQILIALNRIEDTAETLQLVLAGTPVAERPALIATLPRLYSRTQDKKLSARVVEGALAEASRQPPTAVAAWTANGRMRMLAGDLAGAIEAARQAQALDLGAEGPVLLALEMMDGSQPQAEALVRSYLEGKGKPLPELRLAYARALLDQSRHAEAQRELQRVIAEKAELAEAWLLLGTLQAQDNQLAQAEATLRRFLELAAADLPAEELQRGTTQAYLVLAQIAEKRRDYAAAERWLSRIENSADMVGVQSRRASILARQGRMDQARQLLRSLPERSPEDARMKLMAEVQLLREQQMLRQAYELLGAAIARYPQDFELLYEQALLSEKLGNFEEMERLLRELIARRPDHHHAYNALGYSLAERNVRLAEARELVQKALAMAPNDPFIQDSLAWVEFRLGRKDEALRILESAFRARPDPEIAAHMGEVLWSLGQRERATAIWREGLRLNPENDTLVQTLRRLQVKP
ncbi:tetratricopeptide repeat protein [Ramlibacter sp. 2FC]|uniref:tetratricopeptide repeat protein n=1 Tax=Ramlibacter sp. 2FC TaxID=2502188 RepID=UPI0010F7A9FA|nr:tetratricopeptide repeat protein [Ramlibacter sp. 2FC]